MTTERVAMGGVAAFLNAVAQCVSEFHERSSMPRGPVSLFSELLLQTMMDAYELLESGDERRSFLAMAAMFQHSLGDLAVSEWVRNMLPDPGTLD